jgi:dTDP-glucose 4,6-dehydratase
VTKVLLTGAAGFVGSHAVRHLLANTNWTIVAPVSFRHRGLARRIESAVCDQPGADRLEIMHWDMRSPADNSMLRRFRSCDVIWNIASESHVDRSISDPLPFVTNNTLLMLNVLEVARQIEPRLFLQMSTDEVYGPAYGDHRHREWEPPVPSNPYSASKAAQEAIAISYWRTYGVPLVLTNTMNIIGEMQDGEKFLPTIIRNLRDDKPIMVHCDEDGRAGSRFYLHARNLADAWLHLTQTMLDPMFMDFINGETLRYSDGGQRPLRFHIVGEQEVHNDVLVVTVANTMGLKGTNYEIDRIGFHASRPGHDLRYALDGTKLAALGWKPPIPLLPSLEKTVKWYMDNPTWLDR